MSLDSPKRFDRIVAILIQLQSKRIVKAQELADRFDVSLRTIYRDIRTLETSGVPISSEAGVGYSIMDTYRLPPVMFTREEAGSFVAAEKLMQKFTDKTLGAYYESAMFKLKSVLRNTDKEWISAIESQILITPSEELFNKKVPNALEVLFESIAEKTQVLLTYQSLSAEKPTQRKIEPVGLFHENNFWYVLGFCHLRKDYRQFRTDRIQQIKRSSEVYTKNHGTLADHLQKDKKCAPIKVRILVDRTIAKYIKSGRNYYGFTAEKSLGNQIEMTFMVNDLENGFSRWFLMFGDYAKIIEPEKLKIRIKELIEKTQLNL